MPNATQARARGIDRAIALLQCLHAARGPLGIGEIARALGAPRSSLYELTERLLAADILEPAPGNRVYFGRAVHYWGADWLAANDFSRQADALVRKLAKATGQTAQFTTLAGNKYTVEHMHHGEQLFRISSDIGVPVPIPWTASGRLLLGHLRDKEILAFIPAEDFRLPDGRRIDPQAFCAEVRRATAAGHCVTRGLVDGFTTCMASPVRSDAGVTIGCLCLVVPTATANQGALLARLDAEARALSQAARRAPLPPGRGTVAAAEAAD